MFRTYHPIAPVCTTVPCCFIKQVLQDRKELRIVSEYKGLLNSIPLRSIVAVNTSPKVWAGSLREIHVSITGSPDIQSRHTDLQSFHLSMVKYINNHSAKFWAAKALHCC
jgi:hypothetical protein